MYISELIKLDTKSINKMPKDEIIKTITNSKWQWESNIEAVKKAETALVKQSESETSAKLMLVGYLGKEVEKDEYSGKPNLDKLNLCEMIGELMCKSARY